MATFSRHKESTLTHQRRKLERWYHMRQQWWNGISCLWKPDQNWLQHYPDIQLHQQKKTTRCVWKWTEVNIFIKMYYSTWTMQVIFYLLPHPLDLSPFTAAKCSPAEEKAAVAVETWKKSQVQSNQYLRIRFSIYPYLHLPTSIFPLPSLYHWSGCAA